MSLLDDVADLVRRQAGLQLDAVMRARLERALHDLRRPGEDDRSLLDRLRGDPQARQQLYDELTVQETSWFRDPGQFDGLASTVLPLLPDPVVVWSAGCSHGQEAYSLAVLLAEQGRSGRVVATDLSERALARTRAGWYAERELRGLSPERRSRWLEPDGDGYRVTAALREVVEVRRHNLAEEPPPLVGCSVVFCRNVLIYFSRDDVQAVVRRFRQVLPRHGWLFLGFSEPLWTVTADFSSVRLGEAYAYRPSDAPPLPGAARPRPADLPAVPVLADLQGGGTPRGPAQEAAALLATGQRALRDGRAGEAVSAFRGAAYLVPDLPRAHLELGMALEALGERAAARRALQTARRVLASGGDTGGSDPAALSRLVDERLAAWEEGS